jgi:hypothetical protein
MNKRYSTTVATLAAVTIMATGTIAPLLGQTLQTASAQPPIEPQPGLTMFTKILQDDEAGNAVGWRPDGLRRTFAITDEEVDGNDTILINTDQPGQDFVVCSVDNKDEFGFEVNCIETIYGDPNDPPQMPVLEGGPDDGAILYYTVIRLPPVPLTSPSADVLEQTQNATAERREGAEGSSE